MKYLQLKIEHTKTKVRSPQTNGICERFHQTILNEFYRVAFRKKIYGELETLQNDLDEYINRYNNERTHQGKRCQGKTPMQTFIDGKKLFAQKNLNDLVAGLITCEQSGETGHCKLKYCSRQII